MEPYTGTAYTSQEPCWRCGTCLWRLEPPGPGGWRFYCPTCQVGIVAAWPYPLVLETPGPSTSRQTEETIHGRLQQSDSDGPSDPRS
jgi:hypothetical protein